MVNRNRQLQKNVVDAMETLCRRGTIMTISAAAKVLAARNNQDQTLIKISWSTVARTYENWLAFGLFPLDTPRYYLNRDGRWTVSIIAELKRLIDVYPVSYLDELSKKLKEKFKVKFSASAISRRLKLLGYCRKVVFEKASQAIGREKHLFVSALNCT
jgi:hypothetical protein